MNLYTYFRSSAAYRVRIALHLKGLDYQAIPVHLLRDGGQHLQPAYRERNPAGLIPALEDNGVVLTQSLAIIEYLDEAHPLPPLLPQTPIERAQVRALAQAIACDLHPLNNLRVLRYLVDTLGVSPAQKDDWYRHWIDVGLRAVEGMLQQQTAPGRFCWGDTPGLADCLLVPQVFNARRLQCDLGAMPRIVQIVDHCAALPAFERAAPQQQPDAE